MSVSDQEVEESHLFSLVYCSRASAQLPAADIAHIASVARQNNASRHITGWLVYSSGIFFQWLEGKRDDVKRLMQIIAADPRHNTIVVLSEAEEVRERLFSGWDMELVAPEDIRAVLFDAINASTNSKSTDALQKLVQELDSREIATH